MSSVGIFLALTLVLKLFLSFCTQAMSARKCMYRQMAVGDPLAAPPSPQLPQNRIPLMTVAMQLQEGCHSQEWVLHPQAAGLPLSLAEG